MVVFAGTWTTLLQAQQQKLLTLDDLYDPAKKVDFGAPTFPGSGYTWVNDKEYLRVKDARTPDGPSRAEIIRVDAMNKYFCVVDRNDGNIVLIFS